MMSGKSASLIRAALGAASVAAIAALGVAVGCGALGSGKGFVSIRGGKVAALEIVIEGAENGICPGAVHQLVITVTTTRGEKITSWRRGEDGAEPETAGHLDYSDFKAKTSGGKIDPSGRFLVHPDALAAAVTGYKIAIAVADTGTPVAELSFPTRLDCAKGAELRGATGAAGKAGAAGKEAQGDASVPEAPAAQPASGFAAPMAIDTSANGLPGEDGGFGGSAVDAEVASTIVSTPFHAAAVLVRVTPEGRGPRHFLADPASPDGFTIDCRGGDGGAGGGGAGGDCWCAVRHMGSTYTADAASRCRAGVPGLGGSSRGNPGANGTAGEVF